ncbi:MAG TPA: LamG domain-containing protein, partial [Pyrinomonadaceae bacterium]|nr:LamG domain-containing protein [Pyrinomonadaceae bacterium]
MNRIHEPVNKFGPEGSNTISFGSEIRSDNQACFRISTDGTLSTLTDVCTTTALASGQWYHFAGTYDGSEMRLYVNGQNQGAVAKTGDIFASNQNIILGSYGYFPWFLNGSLDEVIITGRAFSETEVQAIYNAGSGGICTGCSPIPHGLVGWWPGEDNAEDVQRANHGQRVNGGTYDPGKVGKSFSFDQANSQYVSLPPGADNLLNNNAGAITVWVNPSSVGDFDIIAAFGSGDPGQAIGLGIHNNIRVYHQGDAYDWLTNTPVTPGTWTFLAYTWDQTTEKVYKNGVLAESRPRVNFIYVPGTAGRIGFGFINDPSVFFTGRIDELAIYDRAIEPGEIARAYSAGANGMCNGCGAQPTGLVSWWPGEFSAEDANLNNFGSLVGGVSFSPGIVGNAFNLNGTSANVRVPDSPTLDFTNEFTLGTWVKPNVIPDYPNGALVISKIGPVSNLNGYQMALTRTGGQNAIWCGFNQAGGGWPQHVAVGGAVPLGEWTYVSCTFDHNTLAVQQNGVRVGSNVVGPITVVNTSSDLRIGADDVGQQFFNGLIDEPTIYNRALSDSELGSVFDNGIRGVCHPAAEPSACAPKPPGMISWWRSQDNALDQTKRHHGSKLPATVYNASKIGSGFEFNAGAGGVEGVDFGNWFDLQVFTIELWVKPKGGQVLYSDILDNGHSSAPRRSWVLQNVDNGNRFHWYSFDFPEGVQLPFDLTPDLWHHLVITRDASRTTRLYLNRSFIGSISSTADIPYDGSQNLRLGNWYSGGRPFNGTLDELAIYDRPLSEPEIAGLYSADAYGKCAAGVTPSDFDGDLST